MAFSVAADIPTPPKMSFDIEKPLEESEKTQEQREQIKQRIWSRLKWIKRDEKGRSPEPPLRQQDTPPQTPTTPPGHGRGCPRRVGIGIPRSTTFRRQEDEQRKNLEPVPCSAKERREVSRVRARAMSAQPVPPKPLRRQGSAPEVRYTREGFPSIFTRMEHPPGHQPVQPAGSQNGDGEALPPPFRESSPPPTEENELRSADGVRTEASYNDALDEELRIELEQKWILNLSMHFRDRSPREKFFVTYAETPQKWRRVTVSVDYRNAPPDSLEADLQTLRSQRDKNARVYESIRMSLGEIQFYDTVTNLKLETRDDRLHVHVTEDVNEIIPYPNTRMVQHLLVKQYRESELHFIEHMSGFVYKVKVGRHTWIKKEIPGQDSVEDFLYEINALNELVDSKNVIELKGLVISDDQTHVKGLLIAYADRGALIDLLYDNRGQMPWIRRERWARHIIRGLSEIHEGGFVQGDFTLSNIVVDAKDRAKVIDINRRGCPIGWEPPEIARLLESRQRISMFIGVKSDLFQLGMVLWALAMEEDEPEMQSRPLISHELPEEIPDYYRRLLEICLSDHPADRLACKDLLKMFPKDQHSNTPPIHLELTGQQFSNDERPAQTIEEFDLDPTPNAERKVLDAPPSADLSPEVTKSSTDGPAETHSVVSDQLAPRGSKDVSNPYFEPRGRSPPAQELAQLSTSPDLSRVWSASTEGANIVPISPTGDSKWAEITLDGTPYLVSRDTLDSLDETDEIDRTAEQSNESTNFQNRRKSATRNLTGFRRDFEHVDSGLADMDIEADHHTPTQATATGLGTGEENAQLASARSSAPAD